MMIIIFWMMMTMTSNAFFYIFLRPGSTVVSSFSSVRNVGSFHHHRRGVMWHEPTKQQTIRTAAMRPVMVARRRGHGLFQTISDDDDDMDNDTPPTNPKHTSSNSNSNVSTSSVCIIGGGLAGLSTAYHLLQQQPSLDVAILDVTAGSGQGGASAVAGGLLHPLSPRGKLVYKGLEGLAATNRLLQAARVYAPNCVLREEIYRVALDEQQRVTLRTTAETLPELTTWVDDEGAWLVNDDTLSSGPTLGALKLHNGCQVVHVPTYLQGLWKACQSIGNGSKEWIHSKEPKDHNDGKNHAAWKEQLSNYSCVVFAAGAGMFQASMFEGDPSLPIQLVRGQSVEMTVRDNPTMDALLCGKYISPMLEANKVLVGATHEFKEEPLSEDDVVKELKDRSYDFASSLWDHGSVDRITTGYRVQSQRGSHGRLPIIGQYQSQHHPNAWIFTGLSSRGLLYHGIYGERLSKMILGETTLVGDDAEIETNWWRS